MANEILKSLLRDYEQKRMKAEIDLTKRKEQLYKSVPRLNEIEEELNSFAINTAKNILANNKYSIEALNKRVEELKKEKEELLKKQNLDLSYLKPKYECEICNDTGYILDNNYKTLMCSCLKQRLLDIAYNKSNMSNLDKENFDTFNLNIFSDKAEPQKFRQNISPRKNMEYIKQKSIDFVDDFDNPEAKNLLFTGNTGLR